MIARLHAWLLTRALLRLSPELRARYAEEWRADLAILSGRPLAATAWAVGLQRASARIHRQAGGEPRAARVAPQLVCDGLALAVAYYAAFALRFGDEVPTAYAELFTRTLPFAIVGGLVCMALAGAYRANAGPLRVPRGVGLGTLTLVATVSLVQPILVSSAHGFVALGVPASVCLFFAAGTAALMLLSRAGFALARARD